MATIPSFARQLVENRDVNGTVGSGTTQFMSWLFRRLALIAFFGTLIAAFLVHSHAQASAITTSPNLATALVLLGGFLITILCATAAFVLAHL